MSRLSRATEPSPRSELRAARRRSIANPLADVSLIEHGDGWAGSSESCGASVAQENAIVGGKQVEFTAILGSVRIDGASPPPSTVPRSAADRLAD
jgi:hypothetical protein